ncbi:hypothetical protein HHI36_021771 [Cryptolaemus montrouzieri]|uniref:Reverse transcriptase domain-containing protein n=1 Tax=Cryptolaemus montrouzieri TaxID=559131 RepID=A0ABD2MXW6_9CUCU
MMYNGLAEMNVGEGCHIVAFADDVAVIVTAQNEEELMEMTNNAVTVDRSGGYIRQAYTQRGVWIDKDLSFKRHTEGPRGKQNLWSNRLEF